jgi:hypothetical protein
LVHNSTLKMAKGKHIIQASIPLVRFSHKLHNTGAK